MIDTAGLLERTLPADLLYVYISLSVYVLLRPLFNQLQPVTGSALTMECDHTAVEVMRIQREREGRRIVVEKHQ